MVFGFYWLRSIHQDLRIDLHIFFLFHFPFSNHSPWFLENIDENHEELFWAEHKMKEKNIKNEIKKSSAQYNN